MIVSPADAADAFTAIADQVLDGQHLLALVQGESVDLDDETDSEVATGFHDRVVADEGDAPASGQSQAYEEFRSLVTQEYAAATEPLNMASLSTRLRTRLGPSISDSNWFGFGSFARAVASLTLSNLRMSQHLLWDSSRHPAPEATTAPPRVALPDPVERLVNQLNLPRVPQPWWPAIYQTLADYAQSQRFNLTQCTSWARDQLREQGLSVSRNAVGFVVRGTSFGGCPLHRLPPPTADEIAAAFVGNVLSRADAAEIAFSEDEIATAHAWLGAPVDNSAEQVVRTESSS
ncbi:hypothetical protein [Micromonospora sp. LOL_023]|uniref:hypothetical protein n=1 Tax=Micromonospora sp. LOL_023 TaxID=3345418 RepID=UPI003A867EC5